MTVFTNIKNYFQNASVELQKVSWPSKAELTRYTILVVAASVLAAVFFSVVDMALALVSRRFSSDARQTPFSRT
jgi:preprotein translocase subunit SecE